MGKSQPARLVGEKLDPYHLPGSVAFWIDITDTRREVILMPWIMPDSYQKSVNFLVRLGIAAYNPDSFDEPKFIPATEAETAKFLFHQNKAEKDAAEMGQPYINRYTAIVHMAEISLSRGMPEPEPEYAQIIPMTTPLPSEIPSPRQPMDAQVIHLATA